MGQTKQAKVLTKTQSEVVLRHLETSRNGKRDKVIFMLSTLAACRAVEISRLRWRSVLDASGEVGDSISIENSMAKSKSGGIVYLNKDLKTALIDYKNSIKTSVSADDYIIKSNRGRHMSAQSIVNWFWSLYKRLGFTGASSHSGRRTFITTAAKKIASCGGSMRDVQMLARHSSLTMTQRYIDLDSEAQRKVVQLV